MLSSFPGQRMARYSDAILWLADNEDATVPIEEFATLVSVCLVADLWNKPNIVVAQEVFAWRKKMEI